MKHIRVLTQALMVAAVVTLRCKRGEPNPVPTAWDAYDGARPVTELVAGHLVTPVLSTAVRGTTMHELHASDLSGNEAVLTVKLVVR